MILTLSRLMRLYGRPAFVRSDNGTEFTSAMVMRWLRDAAIGPAFNAPGNPGTSSTTNTGAQCVSLQDARQHPMELTGNR